MKVIFIDAYNVINSWPNFKDFKKSGNRQINISKNLSVVFTNYGELADTYIERIVHKIGKKSEVIVVTSDYLEQQTVFQRGASRISSLEFYKDICEANSKIKIEIKKKNILKVVSYL